MRRIRGIVRIRRTVFVYGPVCRRAGTSRRPYAESSHPVVGAAAPRRPAASLFEGGGTAQSPALKDYLRVASAVTEGVSPRSRVGSDSQIAPLPGLVMASRAKQVEGSRSVTRVYLSFACPKERYQRKQHQGGEDFGFSPSLDPPSFKRPKGACEPLLEFPGVAAAVSRRRGRRPRRPAQRAALSS